MIVSAKKRRAMTILSRYDRFFQTTIQQNTITCVTNEYSFRDDVLTPSYFDWLLWLIRAVIEGEWFLLPWSSSFPVRSIFLSFSLVLSLTCLYAYPMRTCTTFVLEVSPTQIFFFSDSLYALRSHSLVSWEQDKEKKHIRADIYRYVLYVFTSQSINCTIFHWYASQKRVHRNCCPWCQHLCIYFTEHSLHHLVNIHSLYTFVVRCCTESRTTTSSTPAYPGKYQTTEY